MQVQLLAALLSLQVLAACNQKKFDAGVATREAQLKAKQEETTIPTKPKAPEGPKAPETETITTVIVPVPQPDTSIEFGATEIFRIGDGFASTGSACVGQVNTYKLSGTKYYFQFEVAEDNTQIDLSLGRVCGVDQIDKDTFSLINEQTKAIELAEKPLPKGTDIGPDRPWVPYSPFTLKKGTYSVVINSKNVLGKVVPPGTPIDPNKDEYDDFLVGNIKVKANKKVTAIKIYAE